MTRKHPLKYGCPYCDKRYTSRSGLLSHKNSIHLQRKPYRCEFCNEHFFASASRVAHIHKWHPERMPTKNHSVLTVSSPLSPEHSGAFGCGICGQVFLSRPILENHNMAEHPEEVRIRDKGEKEREDEEEEEEEEEAEENRLLPIHPRSSLFGRSENITIPSKNKESIVLTEKYFCLQCPRSFLETDDLLTHLTFHHDDPGSDSTKTQYSDKISFSLSTQETVSSKRLPPFPFPKTCCGRTFDEPIELAIHFKYHHSREGETISSGYTLRCDRCSRSFKNEENLNFHKSLYCGVSFDCSICGQTFNKIALYAEHARTKHPEHGNETTSMETCDQTAPNRIVCSHCGVAFFDLRIYDIHIKTHEAPKEKCSKCSFKTTSVESMKAHYQSKHIFKCSFCYKVFMTVRLFEHHKRTAHSRQGMCFICPLKCDSERELIKHLKINHSGSVASTSVRCKYCSFETLQINSYLDHFFKAHS